VRPHGVSLPASRVLTAPPALAGYFGTDAWSAAFVEQHEKEEEGRMSSSSLPALDSLRIAPAAASEAETAGPFPSQTPR